MVTRTWASPGSNGLFNGSATLVRELLGDAYAAFPQRPAMPRLSCSITFDSTTVYPFTKGDLSIQLKPPGSRTVGAGASRRP
jgi:hypothetical protein